MVFHTNANLCGRSNVSELNSNSLTSIRLMIQTALLALRTYFSCWFCVHSPNACNVRTQRPSIGHAIMLLVKHVSSRSFSIQFGMHTAESTLIYVCSFSVYKLLHKHTHAIQWKSFHCFSPYASERWKRFFFFFFFSFQINFAARSLLWSCSIVRCF